MATMLQVTLNISDEILDYLRRTANQRQVPLDVVVNEVLAEYFDEPSKADILDNIREALRDGIAGRTRPVDEVLAELRDEFGDYADES
jgi:predicted transcriptional regulator